MKKRLLTVTLALVMTASLAGCGDRPTPKSKEEVKTEEIQEEEQKETSEETDNKQENTEETKSDDAEIKSETQSGAPQLVLYKKNTYEFSDDGEYKELVRGRFNMPLLSDKSAKEYPALAAALEADCKKETAAYDAQITQSVTDAKDWYAEMPDAFYGPWETTQDVSVMRCDEKVVSFFLPVYQFMGGAHGIYGNGYVTYDTQTGKVLHLSDVLTSTDNLTAMLHDELLRQYSDDPDMFFGLDGSLANYVDGESYTVENGDETEYYTGYTWALSSEGVEFYFGPYELAAYAAGAQSVTFKYADHPELFKEEYLPESGPKNYLEYFGNYTDKYDLDGDGKGDVIQIEYEYNDDYSEKTGANFKVNDNSVKLGGDMDLVNLDDEIPGYYIHLTSGKDFVYVIADDFNDYVRYIIYDVTGGDIKPVDDIVFSKAVFDYEEDPLAFKEYFLYDPDCMYLATKFDVICSFTAAKAYHVGDDGRPVSDDDIYTVVSQVAYEPITSIKDFECEVIGDDGSTSKTTLNAGETFRLLTTDGETYVDAQISDGRVVRLYYSGTGYEMKINDIPAEELFKELMYAG